MVVSDTLRLYVEQEILPRYEGFDAAHGRDHAEKVIRDSLLFAEERGLDLDMAYAIAAYHDTGLVADRKTHHLESGRIVRADARLREWFTDEQIETMAQAVEDHRASAEHEPRSIYGCIVAEADRNIDIDTILRRTVQYGLSHYPENDREGHIRRTLEHLDEKYSRHGYLKIWFPGGQNERNLHRLWALIDDEQTIRDMVKEYVDRERFAEWRNRYADSIRAIRDAAHKVHADVNQHYDGTKPYAVHLDMVVAQVERFGHLACHIERDVLPLFFGAYYHDSIEDARLTYNDVVKEARRMGLDDGQALMAAEIVYALTNDKGRTREERAGERYYQGIRETPYAPFCKLCDRLANFTYSLQKTNDGNSRMLHVYSAEMPHFLQQIAADSDDCRRQIPARMVEAIRSLMPAN